MTCLMCGKKLAIFRKSSIGDFCSLEHRALYLAERSDLRPEVGKDERVLTGQASRDLSKSGGKTPQLRGHFDLAQTPAHPRMSLEVPAGRGLKSAPLAGSLALPSKAAGASSRPIPGPGPMSFEIKALLDAHFPRAIPLETQAPAREAQAAEAPKLTEPQMAPAQSIVPEPAGIAPELRSELGRFRCLPVLAMPQPGLKPLAPEPEAPAPISAFDVPATKAEAPRKAVSPIRPPALPVEQFAKPEPTQRHTAQLRMPAPVAIEPEFPLTPLHVEIPAGKSRYDRDEYYEFFDKLPAQALRREREPSRFRKVLPNLQLLAAAACLLVMLGSIAAFMSVPAARSSESGASSAVSGLFSGKLEGVRSLLRSRAAVRYDTDFRSGLSTWSGPAGWSKDWSYDQAGFLRPGKFGLWRQSMPLSDYRMEFLGQIERKSIGWVFRASDEMNYNAAKITITKPGALPMADLIHYSVVNGQESRHSSVHLPFAVRNDTIYRVQLDVQGTQFTTRVNGRMVDSWSDPSHRSGGVGFLSGEGELARVRWLRVSNRDDLLGRICSYLTAQAMLPSPEVLSAFSYQFPEDPEL